MPEECIQHGFDYAVVGEGEIILDALLVFLTEEKLRERVRERIYYSEGLKTRSIDNVPFPDRQSIDISAYKYTIDGVPATTIMTSRGCPYSCSFCARVHEGCRLQSAERTYSEIVHLDTIFGFQAFMIFDDIFIVNRSRTRKLADLLEPYGFLFRCFARSNLITEDNCKQMKRMGVREVGIGVESGSNLVLKRNMKGTSREVNIKAFHTLQKYGIRAKAFLIVGLPGETEETIKETESWIEEAGPYDVDVSIFNPLPGSPIFSDPEKWGIQFHYDGNLNWYKGTPGTYSTTVRTEGLDSHEIVGWRDYLESKYKRKELLR